MIDFPVDFNLADYFLFDRLGEGLEDEVAIRFGERSWTYGAVADRSRALAHWLVEDGLTPEDRVCVVLHDVPPFAWAIFATLAAGGVLTMGNPLAPPADLEYVLGYVKARVLVTTPEVARALAPAMGRLPHLRTVVLVPDAATGDDPEAACMPVLIDEPQRVVEGGGPIGFADGAGGRPRGNDGGLARVRVSSMHAAILDGRTSSTRLPRTHRDAPAVWLFTSGSTGKPKAAMHCHRDFAWNTELYAKRTVGYRRGDVAVSVPRLFFGYATGTNLWFPFAVGGTVGLYSERPTPESLARAIERYRPTIVTNVPTMLGKLLDFDDERRAGGLRPLDLSCVRFHLSAGEALPGALLTRFTGRFGGQVFDGIGSAEMFHIYCTNRPGDVVPGSLGRAVEGYQLAVLPEDAIGPGAKPVPTGEIGVLWVRGDSVAQGYYEDRDKSWRTFHGHWCRTGDLFRLDERGYLWFAGRADDLFKSGGIFVAPLEVEECLGAHEAVSLVAVIGAPDGDDGLVKPKAFVVVRPDARARLATDLARAALAVELQEHVKARLSKHKYPRWIVFVDDLPKNDRGKVDKKTLR